MGIPLYRTTPYVDVDILFDMGAYKDLPNKDKKLSFVMKM